MKRVERSTYTRNVLTSNNNFRLDNTITINFRLFPQSLVFESVP